jgi:16S rRNA processing protein RimM
MRLHGPSNAFAGAQAPQDLVELGRVVSAYGVQGWIKLQPFSAHADVLRTAKQWWLTPPLLPAAQAAVACAPFMMQVQRVRSQGSDLVAQFAQLNDRDQAEMLKGCMISVSRAFFPKAAADEFYWVDLVGCDVYGLDDANQLALIGVVDEVLDNNAHAVLKIRVNQMNTVNGKRRPISDGHERPLDMLVPFVAAHVHNVDLAARRIDTSWPTTF